MKAMVAIYLEYFVIWFVYFVTYESFPKVLSTPMSGISPEKKLVDKFLRQDKQTSHIKFMSHAILPLEKYITKMKLSLWHTVTELLAKWTYSSRKCERRPIDEGIAPFNELLDKSLHLNFVLDPNS